MVVFQNRDHRPAGGDRGAVEGVDELDLAGLVAPEANVEATRLIVSGVGCGSDLAVLAAAREPRLQIILPIGGRAQISRGGVDDSEGETQALEDLHLDVAQALMPGIGILRAAEDEHLHLAELVDAIEAAALATVGAGLGAEAMREPGVGLWQGILSQDLVHVVAAQGDLRRGDQREVTLLDVVNLLLLTPGVEANALEDLLPGEIRRHHRKEALLQHLMEGILLKRQVERHQPALEIVKARSGYLRGMAKVDEVGRFAQLHVVLGDEGELGRLAHHLEDAEVLLAAFWHVRVRQIGDLLQQIAPLGLNRLEVGFRPSDLVAESTQPLALLFGRLPFRASLPFRPQRLHLLQRLRAALVELQPRIQVQRHATPLQVAPHLFGILPYPSRIQHALLSSKRGSWKLAGKPRTNANSYGRPVDVRTARVEETSLQRPHTPRYRKAMSTHMKEASPEARTLSVRSSAKERTGFQASGPAGVPWGEEKSSE